jgi:hypothetical protein
MGGFANEAKRIAGESTFTTAQLEKLFKSKAERDALIEVQRILKEAANANAAAARILELGEIAVRVLVKVGKLALAP